MQAIKLAEDNDIQSGDIISSTSYTNLPANWKQDLATLVVRAHAGVVADLGTMTPAELAGIYRYLKRTFQGVMV